MAEHSYFSEIRRLGIPDVVVEHGEQIELQHECGFDREGIERAALEMLEPVTKSLS
jgi:1-deoxy-D-xylulose-5-phosphate synthase